MKLFKNLQTSIKENKTLEDRFFAVVVMVGLVIVTVSEIVTYVEDITYIANLGTAIGGVMLLLVMYEAYIRKKMETARIMLCYTFNCFVIPITFFTCGGIDSGMPLYMLAGIFTVIPILKGIHRLICMLVSFFVDLLCLAAAYYLTINADVLGDLKQKLLPGLSLGSRYIDVACSIILIGLYVMITTALVMDAYQKERASREELLARLDDLSKRDELTGLYNRRELFRFLEEMPVGDGSYYLCMTDIDHFKNVNDSYGHVFGDHVLRTLAGIMIGEVRTEEGELAARYGGEEFLIVIRADGMSEAVERIDRIRRCFISRKWEEDDALITSFSGGLVRCTDCQSYSDAISRADKLLYTAKESGRNRIEHQAQKQ
ncbi:MAG: GGDEF domain-containing protein [Lachnospiraceae bacterium]|nr:GGDEF domain-containing protein [Lachnospiraceae bacterium]